MDVPLVLVVLGLVAGLAMAERSNAPVAALVIALPIVGAALGHIPAIGAQLNAVALNLRWRWPARSRRAIAITFTNW